MNNFLVKVASTIEKFNMANKSERLLVCLSGGADSVTLLLCLYELAMMYALVMSITTSVGGKATEISIFVKSFARSLGSS